MSVSGSTSSSNRSKYSTPRLRGEGGGTGNFGAAPRRGSRDPWRPKQLETAVALLVTLEPQRAVVRKREGASSRSGAAGGRLCRCQAQDDALSPAAALSAEPLQVGVELAHPALPRRQLAVLRCDGECLHSRAAAASGAQYGRSNFWCTVRSQQLLVHSRVAAGAMWRACFSVEEAVWSMQP